MSMRILWLFAAWLLLPVSGYGQSTYLRGGLGYGIPFATQTIDGTGTPLNGTISRSTSGSVTTYTYDLKKASFAPQFNLTIGGGYLFTDNIGVDLGLFVGSSKEFSYNDMNVTINGVGYNVTVTNQARSVLSVNPSMVLQTGTPELKVYTRVGVALPLLTTITQHQIFTNLPGAGAVSTQDYTWEQKNKFGLGVTAAAGVRFETSERVHVFAELNAISLSVYAKEAQLTDVQVNGQGGYLSQIPVEEQKVYYSKNFSAASTDYYRQPTFASAFSSLYLQVGIQYLLGGSKSRSVNRKGTQPSSRAPRGRFSATYP